MASVITHAIVGASAAYILQPMALFRAARKTRAWYYILAALLAMLPDGDALGYTLGVPYESLWGHRGITHSLLFALAMGIFVAWLFIRNSGIRNTTDPTSQSPFLHLAFVFSLALASHGLLDACTTGGLGIGFFAPFDTTRYFFPTSIRLIRVSPIGVTSFFSEWGMRVLRSEAMWVWLPCIVLTGLVWRERRRLGWFAKNKVAES